MSGKQYLGDERQLEALCLHAALFRDGPWLRGSLF